MAYVGKTNWQTNEIVMPNDMNRIEQGIKDIDSRVGESELQTDNKIVTDAINEINQLAKNTSTKVGTGTLNTTSKNTVGAINEVLTSIDTFNDGIQNINETIDLMNQNNRINTYTSLSQIGISGNPSSIDVIIENLPSNSIIMYEIGENNTSDIYPIPYGSIYIFKVNSYRSWLKYFSTTTDKIEEFTGYYRIAGTPKFSGWYRNQYANTKNVTIGTNWQSASAPFWQNVTVNGLDTSQNPIVDILPSGTNAEIQAQIREWAKIDRIGVGDNKITVWCYTSKPTVNLPIQIKGV